MKKHNRINRGWEALIKEFYGDEPISKEQHDEMKKAFYAGAAMVVNIVIGILSDEESAEVFQELRLECIEFVRSLKK